MLIGRWQVTNPPSALSLDVGMDARKSSDELPGELIFRFKWLQKISKKVKEKIP